MIYKVVSLEAIHDMNELTFHGNTKVGLIAANLLVKRLGVENRNDYRRLRSVTLNLHISLIRSIRNRYDTQMRIAVVSAISIS